ncbi:hypothetical protein A9978_18725 [Pseudomonas sp. UMC65]|uniref:hypothetical protein n=1 Tax=Pseudomonas sp. UMC65 TaxID=1862323 RepID=UPI0016047F4B|nr:hypothetical protein [Pseudomonas sp. UMC65]MBB1614476.1 hypothetical protein [Pseudomonas sp. UMC65]
MSEITRGVISMPFEMAMGSELSRRQFHSIAQSLLIERDLLLLCVNKWEEAAIQREADRDQLRAELAGLRTGFDAQNEVIAGLRKDAERWRFVRNAIPNQSPFAVYREGSRPFFGKWADEAIDAAMGKGVNPKSQQSPTIK